MAGLLQASALSIQAIVAPRIHRNARFLGVHYEDCFKEERLTEVLKPHLSPRPAFRFDKPTDPLIPTTHWSNADELLAYCQMLASSMPDGEFPTEEWLRKRGKYAGRAGAAYNTVAVYIKTWLGGVRNLRRLLGQAHVNTEVWDRDKALAAHRAFYERHSVTPDQARHFRRTKERPFSDEVMKEAARIGIAINKYAGGSAEANGLLGIKVVRKRKWPREKIIEGYKNTIERWGESPHQVLYDHRNGRKTLSQEDRSSLAQMVDAANREFGGSKAVLTLIGFQARSRRWQNRR